MHDLAQPECQVGQCIAHHLENWQVSYGCQRMRRSRAPQAGPRALDRDILEMIFDQFADAWRTVDMRNDLEQEVRRRKRRSDLRQLRVRRDKALSAGAAPPGNRSSRNGLAVL
jgi:hypothetical protein